MYSAQQNLENTYAKYEELHKYLLCAVWWDTLFVFNYRKV